MLLRGSGLDARDPQRLFVAASVRNGSQAPNGDRRREEEERQSSHGALLKRLLRLWGSEVRKKSNGAEPYRAGSGANEASEADPNLLYDGVADTLVSLLLRKAQHLHAKNSRFRIDLLFR
jgi:hypothetical protein